MLDAMDAVGVGEAPLRPVAQHRAVLPTGFPQFINRLHIVFGDFVAVVVAGLLRPAHAARGAVQVSGDDVPADPPAGQMIQGAHAAGEGVGVFVGQGAGDAETEVPGHVGHGGNDHQRVVHRHLHGVFQRGGGRSAVDIVNPQHVGQEDRVELAALQRAGEVHPVVQRVVAVRPVARVGPQAGRLVADAVHVEGVQADLLRHWGWTLGGGRAV